MANVRSINKDKYQISKFRFRELYYFCLQYDEWKEELEDKHNPLKAMEYSGMPGNAAPGNPTQSKAIICAELSHKCDLIENAAKRADPELWEFILYAVTHEGATFDSLKIHHNIPCERDRYYMRRRMFYFYLDQAMKKNGGERNE